MDFFQCIQLEKAQELIIDSLVGITVERETVLLVDALGRVLAEDIIAKENLPPFSRSTVDGFAVRSIDTFGAGETASALFSIVGEVAMGEQAELEILPGQALTVPTGGMLPSGADAVIMLEYTEQPDACTLLVSKMVGPGENIIAEGEDIRLGTVILKKGQKLAPQHIAVLAADGWVYVSVCRRIKVAIISTGDELVDIAQPIIHGQIRDINSYALGAMLAETGCKVKLMGIVKDSYELFFTTLQEAVASCQLVVISGGSSVGTRDFAVRAIEAMGTPGVLIHGIAVKPGKPTIFGMSGGGVPIFGLPGHPTAAMIVCEQLVKLAVRKLLGQKQVLAEHKIQAYLNRNVASVPGRDDFINVRLSKHEGRNIATPLLGKSGLISLMAHADGIIHIPAGKSGVYDGDLIEVAPVNGG